MRKDYISLVNSKNFYVGDVEKINDKTTFVRIYFDETGLKKLNNVLHSHINMTEWITMVINEKNKCKKIVVYSEKDNHEYDITETFSKKLITYLLKDLKLEVD